MVPGRPRRPLSSCGFAKWRNTSTNSWPTDGGGRGWLVGATAVAAHSWLFLRFCICSANAWAALHPILDQAPRWSYRWRRRQRLLRRSHRRARQRTSAQSPVRRRRPPMALTHLLRLPAILMPPQRPATTSTSTDMSCRARPPRRECPSARQPSAPTGVTASAIIVAELAHITVASPSGFDDPRQLLPLRTSGNRTFDVGSSSEYAVMSAETVLPLFRLG